MVSRHNSSVPTPALIAAVGCPSEYADALWASHSRNVGVKLVPGEPIPSGDCVVVDDWEAAGALKPPTASGAGLLTSVPVDAIGFVDAEEGLRKLSRALADDLRRI